jgi:hypothetical protein
MRDNRARTYGRIAAGVLVTWVLITGAIAGIGGEHHPTDVGARRPFPITD